MAIRKEQEPAINWGWWLTPIIPALGRLRQDCHKSKANRGYIVSSSPVSVTEKTLSQKIHK